MPLAKGNSKKSFTKNMKMMMKEGKPRDQALAIAYDVAARSKRKKK